MQTMKHIPSNNATNKCTQQIMQHTMHTTNHATHNAHNRQCNTQCRQQTLQHTMYTTNNATLSFSSHFLPPCSSSGHCRSTRTTTKIGHAAPGRPLTKYNMHFPSPGPDDLPRWWELAQAAAAEAEAEEEEIENSRNNICRFDLVNRKWTIHFIYVWGEGHAVSARKACVTHKQDTHTQQTSRMCAWSR